MRLATSIVCAAWIACAQMPAGLVAEWAVDGLNSTGRCHNTYGGYVGTAQGNATATGAVWSFDGVNDYVQLGTNGVLDGATNCTIEFWCRGRPTDSASAVQLCRYLAHTNAQFYATAYYAQQWLIVYGDGPGSNRYSAISNPQITNRITNVVWHHSVSVWRGGTNFDLYWDKLRLPCSVTTVGTGVVALSTGCTAPITMGIDGTLLADFAGDMTACRIFRLAVDQAYVSESYERGRIGKR